MLTIHNLNRITYRQLDKKNFYVERIIEIYDIDPVTAKLSNYRYRIEITNREYAMAVFLDRTPVMNEQNYYRLYDSGRGIPIYLTIGEIKNMYLFLDKIRLVALN